MERHTPMLIAMYYFKMTSDIGPDGFVDDYFEADGRGALRRVVSHAGGRWWASRCEDGEFDLWRFDDLEPVSRITGEEFERVWNLAAGEAAPVGGHSA